MGHVLQGTYTPQDYRNFVTKWDKQTRQMSLIKPGRALGGAWLDNFIGQRKAISLCPDCERKYGDWQNKVGYSKREHKEITDCDGCGETPVLCQGYFSSLVV